MPGGIALGAGGLVPVVVQDHDTGQVLMVAWASLEAVRLTARTREAHFYSRSRQRLWRKGETSGNVMDVVSLRADCDRDCLLYTVRPRGPACHTQAVSCFDAAPGVPGPRASSACVPAVGVLADLDRVIQGRKTSPPEGSYTARLLAQGLDKILRKVTEETTEVLLAAKDGDPDALAWEVADVLYHLLVLLAQRDVPLDRVLAQLASRRGQPPRATS